MRVMCVCGTFFYFTGGFMAQYDGSIRINTEITTKNAKIQLATLENSMSKTADKVESLRSKMDALKDAKIPTQEYSEISTQIQKAESEFNKLLEKQEQMQREGKDSGVAWERLNEKMEEIGNTIRYAQGELQDLVDTGKAFTLGSDTEEFAKLGQQLQYAENDLSVLNQRHDLLLLKQKKNSDGYKKLGDTAKKSFEKLNKSVKKSSGFMKNFASRLKGIALSLLIFNWITKAFNAVVKSIKEGFENLYKDNERFQNSINDLRASALTMKNAFAAAFRPLVDIAIPYIQKTIEYITQLLDKFGQFTALITGQKTYTKAIKQTADAFKDAKKSADGYLSPLDEINKFQKEDSEEQEFGTMFEEVPINQKFVDMFQKIKDAIKPILDYADKLKDIFKQGFFDGLGDWEYRWDSIKDSIKSIKDSLKDIFTDPAVLAAADRWAQSVAYLLGSLAGSMASIGLTIATNLLGGIAKYLDQNKERIKSYLISMFDIWAEINQMFAELFQSIAYVFEAFASEQGQQLTANIIGIFTDAFMGITELASKIFRDIAKIIIQPFVDNKEAFRTALEGFLGVLASVTGTIKDGIDATFDKLNEVYDTHFKPFFDSVAQGLSDLVGEFMEFWNGKVQPILDQMASDFDALWKTHIQPLLDNAAELLGKVADLLKAIWENILQPFISWIISNVLPVILPVIQAIWDMLVDFVGYIADAISSIIDILGGIIDFLTGVFTGDWELAFQGLENIVSGFIELVVGIIEGFVSLVGNIVEAFFEAIKGLLNVFVDFILGAVKKFLDYIKKNIIQKGNEIKSGISSFLSGVKNTWNQAWDSLVNKVKEVFENIKNVIKSAIDWISEKISSIKESFGNIKSTVSGFFSGDYENSARSYSMRSIPSPYATNPSYAALSSMPIPRLATGAVIPANKEFLAVLGDQKHGTNVEAPLDTIRQSAEEAVLNVFSRIGMSGGNMGGTPVNLTLQVALDGQVLGQKMVDWGKLQQMATGINPYGFGTT